MGIQDRDYMRRSSDPSRRRTQSADEQLEGLVGAWLKRHPRFLPVLGLGIAALVIVALLIARYSG